MLSSFEDELVAKHTNHLPELIAMINGLRELVALGFRFDSVVRFELHDVHYLISGLNEDRPQIDFDREREHQLRLSDFVPIVGLVPTQLSPQAQGFQPIRNTDAPTLGNDLTLGINYIQAASEKSLHVPSQPHKLNQSHATPVQENNSILMDLKLSGEVTGVEKSSVNIEPPSFSNISEPPSSSKESTIAKPQAIDFVAQIPTAQEFAITQGLVSAPLTDACSIQEKSPVQVSCSSSHTTNNIAVSEAELKSLTDNQDALERLREKLRKKVKPSVLNNDLTPPSPIKRVDPQIPLQVATSSKIASKTLGKRTKGFDSGHDFQRATKKNHTTLNPNQDESCDPLLHSIKPTGYRTSEISPEFALTKIIEFMSMAGLGSFDPDTGLRPLRKLIDLEFQKRNGPSFNVGYRSLPLTMEDVLLLVRDFYGDSFLKINSCASDFNPYSDIFVYLEKVFSNKKMGIVNFIKIPNLNDINLDLAFIRHWKYYLQLSEKKIKATSRLEIFLKYFLSLAYLGMQFEDHATYFGTRLLSDISKYSNANRRQMPNMSPTRYLGLMLSAFTILSICRPLSFS